MEEVFAPFFLYNSLTNYYLIKLNKRINFNLMNHYNLKRIEINKNKNQ